MLHLAPVILFLIFIQCFERPHRPTVISCWIMMNSFQNINMLSINREGLRLEALSCVLPEIRKRFAYSRL